MSEPRLKSYEEWLGTGEHPELALFRKKVDEIKIRMVIGDRLAAHMQVVRQVEDLRAGFTKDEEMEEQAVAGLDQRDKLKSQLAAVQERLENQKD